MRRDHDVHARVAHVGEQVEHAAELLQGELPALAEAQRLHGVPLVLRAQLGAQQALGPVGGVEHQRAARALRRHVAQQALERRPALRGLRSGHVVALGAALGVDEQGVGELRGQRRLADALDAVDHDFLGLLRGPARYLDGHY